MSKWTSARKEKQRAQIQQWKPWQQSTGPRTAEGKKISAQNAYKGGQRQKLREIRGLLAELDAFDKPDIV